MLLFLFSFFFFTESEGSFEFDNHWREVEDLRAVIEHFCGANREVSAILGHSKGGDVVLLYASKYHDIRTVTNVSARFDPKKGIEERYEKEFLEKIKRDGFVDVKNGEGSVEHPVGEKNLIDLLNTDMHKVCLQIDTDCRVFTVHGSAVEVNQVEDALEFAKIIPNHKLHIVEGADHSYTSHQAEMTFIVLDWIKTAMQSDKGDCS